MQELIEHLGINPERLGELSEAGQAVLAAVDIDAITESDLDVFRELFDAEAYRRAQLAAIPKEVAAKRAQYVALGGDPADLD